MMVLNSFYEFNTYGNVKLIVAEDGPENQQLKQVALKYPQVKWVITGAKVGQLAATDLAYKQITSQFYIHGQNDFIYLKKGFIQYALREMRKDPLIASVPFMPYLNYQTKTCNILDLIYCGLTLNPSLHRISHYKQIDGGYVGLTHNLTYGIGAGVGQELISGYYMEKGYRTVCLLQAFILHIGDGRGSKRRLAPYWLLHKDRQSLNQNDKIIYDFADNLSNINMWPKYAVKDARKYFSQGFPSETWHPIFYQTFSDVFQTYAMIQLSGPEHIQFFDDFLISRPERQFTEKCEKEKEDFTQSKARVKTPLKVLNSLLDDIERQENYQIPDQVLLELKQKYSLYAICLEKLKNNQ